MKKVILLPSERDAVKKPEGLSRRQGHLILILLAANVIVQLWGSGALYATSFGMQILIVSKWVGIIAGATALIGLVLIACYIGWNGYWLGKRSRTAK